MADQTRRTRTSEYHPLDRATDTSKLATINTKLGEYRLFVYLIFGILVALGFKFESPGARVGQVEKRIATIEDSVSVIRLGQVKTHNALEVLVRLRCFDTTLTAAQMKLAGLDCSDIDHAQQFHR